MKKFIVVIFLLAIVVLGVLTWWYSGLAPYNAKDKTYRIFVIEKNAGIRAIVSNLKKEQLIRDSIVFFLLVKHYDLDQKIQAGSFRLSPSMSAPDIALALTKGTIDIWITIPEGYRGGEIADVLSSKIPTYEKSWGEVLQQNEGYLFPDTYLIPKDADIKLIVKILNDNFEKKFGTVYSEDKTKLTKDEVVNIASLVEREARHPEDRPLVASVILNRLNQGMKLDIDATIQYALGKTRDGKNWWPEITQDDYVNIRSPFNTYLHARLPPTPIANPGLASLGAVIYPAKTNYLYYISDIKGINHYAETIEEHNANIKKYR